MARPKWELIPADQVRPSDYATPLTGDHPETKVLTVMDDAICLVIDRALTGMLPKHDYTFRRKYVR